MTLAAAGELGTARLLLPPLTADHLGAVTVLYADPEVARFVGGSRLTGPAIAEQVQRFAGEWAERGYGQSAVIDRASGAFLGRIGLHYFPAWGEVELGYVLARAAQGRGLAAEGCRRWIAWAGDAAEIDHLVAGIDAGNGPSIRLATGLGFGFDREDVMPSGAEVRVYRLDL